MAISRRGQRPPSSRAGVRGAINAGKAGCRARRLPVVMPRRRRYCRKARSDENQESPGSRRRTPPPGPARRATGRRAGTATQASAREALEGFRSFTRAGQSPAVSASEWDNTSLPAEQRAHASAMAGAGAKAAAAKASAATKDRPGNPSLCWAGRDIWLWAAWRQSWRRPPAGASVDVAGQPPDSAGHQTLYHGFFFSAATAGSLKGHRERRGLGAFDKPILGDRASLVGGQTRRCNRGPGWPWRWPPHGGVVERQPGVPAIAEEGCARRSWDSLKLRGRVWARRIRHSGLFWSTLSPVAAGLRT